MKFEIFKSQFDAANENLARINAPVRLVLTQNYHSRITLHSATPEQISKDMVGNLLISYNTVSDASKFIMGFNACLLICSHNDKLIKVMQLTSANLRDLSISIGSTTKEGQSCHDLADRLYNATLKTSCPVS